VIDPNHCRVTRDTQATNTKQGLLHFVGVSAENSGATGLCMHLGIIPPGAVAEPHMHEGHETAIYMISGHARFYYGATLDHEEAVGPGDFIYLGPSVPHQPYNESDTEPVHFLVARTDPAEQESVVLLPSLKQTP